MFRKFAGNVDILKISKMNSFPSRKIFQEADVSFSASISFWTWSNLGFEPDCVFRKCQKMMNILQRSGKFQYKMADASILNLNCSRRRGILKRTHQMCWLLYEFPAETRLTVYRRLDIKFWTGPSLSKNVDILMNIFKIFRKFTANGDLLGSSKMNSSSSRDTFQF